MHECCQHFVVTYVCGVTHLPKGEAMTATTTETEEEVVYELSSRDRCDSCGAQAYMRATLANGSELLFCAHHGNKHREKLSGMGVTWHDESHRLSASNRA